MNLNLKASAGPWERPQQTDREEEESVFFFYNFPFGLHTLCATAMWPGGALIVTDCYASQTKAGNRDERCI